MKRSRMLIKMQRVYAIRHVMLESGYINLEQFMDELLKEMEHEGMSPPGYCKPIPFEDNGKQYPLVPGDFLIDGVWCTPGVQEWEPEELIVTNVDVENKTVTFKTVTDNE